MGTIHTHCRFCGDLDEMPGEAFVVGICNQTRAVTYAFQCPLCRFIFVRPIRRPKAVEELLRHGAEQFSWDMPRDRIRPSRNGTKVDHNYLIDFHRFIHNDNAAATALQNLAIAMTRTR